MVQMSPFLQDEGYSHVSHIFNFHQLLKHEISTKFPFPRFKFGARGGTGSLKERKRGGTVLHRGWGSRTEKDRKAQTQDGPGLWLKRQNPDKDSGLRQLLVQNQTWVLNVGTGTPAHLGPSWEKWGCQLLAVLQGKGGNLESRKGWRGEKKRCQWESLYPVPIVIMFRFLLKDPQWRPVASRPNSSAQPSRHSTFWAPHTYPILTLPLRKTRLPVLVRRILLLTGDGTIPL